jgi:general stress protein YciG
VTKARKKKLTPEHMREIGARGGRASAEIRRAKYGAEFMDEISVLGVKAHQRIIEAGKRALEKEEGRSPT